LPTSLQGEFFLKQYPALHFRAHGFLFHHLVEFAADVTTFVTAA
jgi:hypothetical protein